VIQARSSAYTSVCSSQQSTRTPGRSTTRSQIRDPVLEEIARGRANEGDWLPSARSLASTLGVNFRTVAKAYPALEADGVVIGDRQRRLRILLPLTATLEFSLDWERRQRLLLAAGLARGLAKEEIHLRLRRFLGEVPDTLGSREPVPISPPPPDHAIGIVHCDDDRYWRSGQL
jgi:DNA-binding transcriptional regulator YhcF (GntR family)